MSVAIRSTIRVVVLVAVLTAAVGCGSDNAETAVSTPTTTAASTTTPDSTAPDSAAPDSTATTSTTTTVTAPATSGSTPTDTPSTTAAFVDTEAPPAPTNVTCAPGGGFQEILLEWDAPAEPEEIVDVRFYVNDGSGLAPVNTFTVESGQVLIGAFRWSAVAYPVPAGREVQMAVTVADAAGNESGWNPIDVYSEYSGADCVN